MLHSYVILHNMARGESGRIVLEIDPFHKDELYSALTKDGVTLKAWFLRQATEYLRNRGQMPLFGAAGVAETPAQYKMASVPISAASTKTKRVKAKVKSK